MTNADPARPGAFEELAADDIEARAAAFARTHIAPREDLTTMEGFPFDLWAALGETGLLGAGLPPAFGGLGGDYETLQRVGEALVRFGHNRGMAASATSHNVVAKFFLAEHGTDAQKALWLPRIATGEVTASIAISEPGAGAHPKRLSTTAERQGDTYVLNGEKAYLTNGPIAKLYLVLAITAMEGERKRYSIFMVPRDTPGITLTNAGSVGFLRPSPHGGLHIANCAVPAGNLLGPEGEAYERLARPLRDVEDTVGLGSLAGGFGLQIDRLAHRIREIGLALSDDLKERLAALEAMRAEIAALARLVVRAMEASGAHRPPEALLIGVRNRARDFARLFEALHEALGTAGDPVLDRFLADRARGRSGMSNVDRLKHLKLADEVLARAG